MSTVGSSLHYAKIKCLHDICIFYFSAAVKDCKDICGCAHNGGLTRNCIHIVDEQWA